jgi:hypothetical protein
MADGRDAIFGLLSVKPVGKSIMACGRSATVFVSCRLTHAGQGFNMDGAFSGRSESHACKLCTHSLILTRSKVDVGLFHYATRANAAD